MGGKYLATFLNVIDLDPQVNFYVRNVETSVRFFRDLFGFWETFRIPKEG